MVCFCVALDSGIEQSNGSQGTPAEGAIPKLLAGKMKSFIKCVNVNYELSRVEEFYGEKERPTRVKWSSSELTCPAHRIDIQLDVKGMRTLYDSFQDYVTVEMLGGEFKYQAEGFGPQDAHKGIIFQSFPPVLHLSLKRYEYDPQCDAMVKVSAIRILRGCWFDSDPPRRSMIALNSPLKLILATSSMRPLTGPNPGSTGFTACLCIPVTFTVDSTSLSSNQIDIRDGSNSTTHG